MITPQHRTKVVVPPGGPTEQMLAQKAEKTWRDARALELGLAWLCRPPPASIPRGQGIGFKR